MTARELARILGARRTGKGKWTSKCPSHPDRTPSLSIGEGRKGIVLKCMSAGCDTKAILDALGLSWADLFHGAPDAELKGRLADERKIERLDRRFGLVLWMLSLSKHSYWLTAARRIGQERRDLREKLDPALKVAREFQERVKCLGWDRIWDEFLSSDKGRQLSERYGILGDSIRRRRDHDAAGEGPAKDAGNLREDRLHGPPP